MCGVLWRLVCCPLPPPSCCWPLLLSDCLQDSFYKSLTEEDRANISGGWALPQWRCGCCCWRRGGQGAHGSASSSMLSSVHYAAAQLHSCPPDD